MWPFDCLRILDKDPYYKHTKQWDEMMESIREPSLSRPKMYSGESRENIAKEEEENKKKLAEMKKKLIEEGCNPMWAGFFASHQLNDQKKSTNRIINDKPDFEGLDEEGYFH